MVSRYVARGIAEDISEGKQVVVLPAPYDTVSNILHQVREYTDESYTSVSHAASTITDISGGQVSIFHNVEKLRGRQIDVLVVPDAMDSAILRYFLQQGAELIRY